MTDAQRADIAGYRKQGYGYKKISQLTGISENTIKTYCKRNSIGAATPSIINRQISTSCDCCGAAIIQQAGKKRRRFCDDTCRNRWWNSHLDQVNRKAVYEYICPVCGKKFTAYGNAHRKYCSHECYIADRFGDGE